MAQGSLPLDFNEGNRDERLIRLAKWAAKAHPGKKFTFQELEEITGIPATTLFRIQGEALDELAPKLIKIRNELKNEY